MKCSLCNADLIPGNNTCPSCGALIQGIAEVNTPVVQNQEEDLEVLASSPEVQPIPSNQEQVVVNAQNDADGDGIIEQFEDLDSGDAEVVNASADMAAPSLEVDKENLTSGVQDIASSNNASTYDPTQEQPVDEEINVPKEAGVNFELPEIQEAQADTQGMDIMQIETKGTTVGEESAPIKEKFSIKMLSKKSYPRKFVIILVVVALVIGVLVGSTVFGKKVYNPGTTTKKTTVNKVQHVADGSNNKTYAGNYVYTIPTLYDFDKRDDGIVIFGQEDEFRIFIKSAKGNYEKVANAKESIRRSLNNIGISVNDLKETTVGEDRFIIVQALTNTTYRLYGIRSGNNEDIFYVEIISPNSEYYYAGLDIANDIIKNSEFNSKYTKMETGSYDDVSAIISTVAEKYSNP